MKTASDFAFHKVFSSHMVIQRGEPVVFSGIACCGQVVRVTFNGMSCDCVVDDENEWRASFTSLEAGGPYTATAENLTSGKALELDDLMVGDVWVCSGQSNMEMPLWSENPFFRAANCDEEKANANYPNIRILDTWQTRTVSPDGPRYDLNGNGVCWKVCTPESAGAFSACGYFFARQLHKDLNVPIGIVSAYWGGTDIAAWISLDKMTRCGWKPFQAVQIPEEMKQAALEKWQQFCASEDGLRFQKWLKEFDACCAYDTRITEENFDDSSWVPCNGIPNVPAPGRYAHRIAIQVPEDLAEKEFVLCLGRVDDMDTTYFNGRLIGETRLECPNYWEAPREYVVPMGVAHAGRNVVTIIHDDHCNKGVCLFQETIPARVGKDVVQLEIASFRTACLKKLPAEFPTRQTITPMEGLSDRREAMQPNHPCTLYNSLVAPLHRLHIRGVIWYQGCDNFGQLSYYPLMKMLIDDWRERWFQPNMPFLMVQLAAYHNHQPENRMDDAQFVRPTPVERPLYAIIREIQAEVAREVPNVAAIVAFDRGDHSDVHPRDKQTLGFRLAKKAEQMLFNDAILADGPTFAGMRMEQNVIRIFFNNTGSGLTTTDGQPPLGFVLGDRRGKMVHAQAVIDGKTILVSSPEIPEPQFVRYAFANYCQVNLCNKEGFAAMPFRSDKIDYKSMFAY